MSAVAGSSVITVIGLFLGTSPWLWGLNHGGSHWSLATKTDFWSGLGLVVVGLAAMALYRAELSRNLALAGVISRRPTLEENAPEAEEPSEAAPEPVTDEVLLALATAVVRDIESQHGSEASGPETTTAVTSTTDTPVSEDDLMRLAMSLLTEIRASKPEEVPQTDTAAPPSEKPLGLMSDSELFHMAADLLQEIQKSNEYQTMPVSREEGSHE